MAKIQNFVVWGLYSHIFAQLNLKFSTGADLPTRQISRLSGQRVAPAG